MNDAHRIRRAARALPTITLLLAASACGPASPAVSPGPSGAATGGPSASPVSTSAPTGAPTPEPTLTGSMPPVSMATWATVTVESRPDVPVAIAQIVSWSGGELALGGLPDGTPMPAWLSRDGRHWVRLPPATFGTTSSAVAAAAASDLVVVGMDAESVMHAYHSTDGLVWTTSRPAVFGNNSLRELAGSEHGFVGLLNDTDSSLVSSPDGRTWSKATLPADGMAQALSVAATADGFVAAGSVMPNAATGDVMLAVSTPLRSNAAAWFSADGMTWQPATVVQGVTEALGEVSVGATGLMALGIAGGTPGLTTYWTSTEGRSWAPSEGPLGSVPEGEGVGGVNGLFHGDGTRIIVTGSRSSADPIEWLTSPDGRHWTTLRLLGEVPSVPWYDMEPLLVRDGIVFAAARQTWFGVAAP